jgi:hypothetical protein
MNVLPGESMPNSAVDPRPTIAYPERMNGGPPPRTPIGYGAPLAEAWALTRSLLFAPFDASRWFALGFTAWLAALVSGGPGVGGSWQTNAPSDAAALGDFALHAVREYGLLLAFAGAFLAVIGIALALALTWVSSRGKFMFLDNVLARRALIQHPWNEFAPEALSYFWWRLAFGLAALLALAVPAAGLAAGAIWCFQGPGVAWTGAMTAGAAGLLLLLALAAVAFTGLLAEEFVLPLMWRHRCRTLAAWRLLLPAVRARPGPFLLYALLRGSLGLAVGMAVFTAIVLTCCCLAVPLMIPYIGTVVLLPIPVFFRALGPRFLRQFGAPLDIA